MNDFKISKQTEAEKDQFLIDCFHDAGFIKSLLESNISIVSGRKGTGKTALARYLENTSRDHGVDFILRISIRDFSLEDYSDSREHINSILFFVIITTVKRFLEKDIFDKHSKGHWNDFLLKNGLQNVVDYDTFVTVKKQNVTGFSMKAFLGSKFAHAEGDGSHQEESSLCRSDISNSPASLIQALRESMPEGKKIIIFLDDVSDYLDTAGDEKVIKKEISAIQEILLRLESYNSIFCDSNKDMRFISLIREDLFGLMLGSNINKLKTNSLSLEWDEDSFASLLIRRLPFYSDTVEESLRDPKKAIQKVFPNEIFSTQLKEFYTNTYITNFYAYMVAISFNRPRDFLMFCYAMRERLSLKHPATFENIESAEIEYSDYFTRELRDELFLVSKILNLELDQEKIDNLIELLNKKDGFNTSELKTDLSKYLGEKTSLGNRKIEAFIENLWWYGVLGLRSTENKGNNLISFRYISKHLPFVVAKIKSYTFYLHRGLWWFAQKRKK